jgi:hypothetical protein
MSPSCLSHRRRASDATGKSRGESPNTATDSNVVPNVDLLDLRTWPIHVGFALLILPTRQCCFVDSEEPVLHYQIHVSARPFARFLDSHAAVHSIPCFSLPSTSTCAMSSTARVVKCKCNLFPGLSCYRRLRRRGRRRQRRGEGAVSHLSASLTR